MVPPTRVMGPLSCSPPANTGRARANTTRIMTTLFMRSSSLNLVCVIQFFRSIYKDAIITLLSCQRERVPGTSKDPYGNTVPPFDGIVYHMQGTREGGSGTRE